MRILIAEDEKDLNGLMCKKLKAASYSVDGCYNGEEALAFLDAADYDLLILDIMMPKKDGLEVLHHLREAKKTIPVLLLSAKDCIEDRVHGLDAGADDYLIKPFSFAELLARIRVLLRKPANVAASLYQVDDLILHLDTQQVFRAGKEIQLTAKEFTLLRYLMQNAGIVLSREKLEQHVWNFDFTGGSNVIDVYIRYLRKKVEDGHERKLIHTIRGIGYVIKETL